MGFIGLLFFLSFATQFFLQRISPIVGNPYEKKWLPALIMGNASLISAMVYKYSLWTMTDARTKISVVIILMTFAILVPIILIDFRDHEIPNEFTLMIAVMGLVYAVVNISAWDQTFPASFILIAMFLFVYFITKGQIGMGDVKLVGALGFTITMARLSQFVIVSFLSGAVISVILLLLKKKKGSDKIAFGPYLCLGYFVLFFL